MKTNPECIPCFLNQALNVMKTSDDLDNETKTAILKKILNELAKFDSELSPPEFALFIYKTIEDALGNKSFYDKIKSNDNSLASCSVPEVMRLIRQSKEPLQDLARVAVFGNCMDFAINSNYDILSHIKNHAESEFAINDWQQLKDEIQSAKSIAYIVDNAGEIIFDKLLIEEIVSISDATLTVFVRSRPILNDVTLEDARVVGLDSIPNVKIEEIDTVFPFINKSNGLEKTLQGSDLVISKGQANYECLSESDANIYFMLVAKCDVIARSIGVKKGNFIILKNKKKGKCNL